MNFEQAVQRFGEMIVGRRIEGVHWLNDSVSVLLEGEYLWTPGMGSSVHMTTRPTKAMQFTLKGINL